MCGWRDPPRLNLAGFFTLTLSYRRQKRLAVRHTSHTFCFRATLASSAQMCILHRRAGHSLLGEPARGHSGWGEGGPAPRPPRPEAPHPQGRSPLLVVLAAQAPQMAHGLVHAERVVPRLGKQVGEAAPGFPGGNCRGTAGWGADAASREHSRNQPTWDSGQGGAEPPMDIFLSFHESSLRSLSVMSDCL